MWTLYNFYIPIPIYHSVLYKGIRHTVQYTSYTLIIHINGYHVGIPPSSISFRIFYRWKSIYTLSSHFRYCEWSNINLITYWFYAMMWVFFLNWIILMKIFCLGILCRFSVIGPLLYYTRDESMYLILEALPSDFVRRLYIYEYKMVIYFLVFKIICVKWNPLKEQRLTNNTEYTISMLLK